MGQEEEWFEVEGEREEGGQLKVRERVALFGVRLMVWSWRGECL